MQRIIPVYDIATLSVNLVSQEIVWKKKEKYVVYPGKRV